MSSHGGIQKNKDKLELVSSIFKCVPENEGKHLAPHWLSELSFPYFTHLYLIR